MQLCRTTVTVVHTAINERRRPQSSLLHRAIQQSFSKLARSFSVLIRRLPPDPSIETSLLPTAHHHLCSILRSLLSALANSTAQLSRGSTANDEAATSGTTPNPGNNNTAATTDPASLSVVLQRLCHTFYHAFFPRTRPPDVPHTDPPTPPTTHHRYLHNNFLHIILTRSGELVSLLIFDEHNLSNNTNGSIQPRHSLPATSRAAALEARLLAPLRRQALADALIFARHNPQRSHPQQTSNDHNLSQTQAQLNQTKAQLRYTILNAIWPGTFEHLGPGVPIPPLVSEQEIADVVVGLERTAGEDDGAWLMGEMVEELGERLLDPWGLGGSLGGVFDVEMDDEFGRELVGDGLNGDTNGIGPSGSTNGHEPFHGLPSGGPNHQGPDDGAPGSSRAGPSAAHHQRHAPADAHRMTNGGDHTRTNGNGNEHTIINGNSTTSVNNPDHEDHEHREAIRRGKRRAAAGSDDEEEGWDPAWLGFS